MQVFGHFLLLISSVVVLSFAVTDKSTHDRSLVVFEEYNITSTEYQFLVDLYNATAGAEWIWGQAPGIPWNFTDGSSPCLDEWEGLVCTPTMQDGYMHIETIYMPSYFMWGYLPDSVGNLDYLQNLSLSGNYFTGGGLPDSIGQLTQLRYLLLDETFMNGTIPESLGMLTELQVFDLGSNVLHGTFPSTLCTLTNLTYLDFSGNAIYGTLPLCLGNLSRLNYFSVDDNKMRGTLPDSIGQLQALRTMLLSNNLFTGTLPKEMSNYTNITDLEMGTNEFSGMIPSWLGELTNLLYLDMGSNHFNGTLPPSLGNLTNLALLYVDENYLTGTIPLSFAKHLLMTQLDFSSNMLSGPFPDYIGNFSALFGYGMYQNYFTGTIPDGVSKLLILRAFNFGANLISGSIPSSNWNQSALFLLVGTSNRLVGSIPDSLFKIEPLYILELAENYLTGLIPDPVIDSAQTMALWQFSAGFNQLTGPLPLYFSALESMEDLNLTHNHVTGPIPSFVTDLQVMNFLYVSFNLMSGTLPEGWDQLPALSYLYLDSNFFSGPIPDSLGHAQLLMSLNLSTNHFTGTVPRSFAHRNLLQVMLLQDNALVGNLDGVFNATHQTNLTTIQLSDNQFSGNLPAELFELTMLQVVAAVSNCFTGSLPPNICNSTTINTLALDGLQSASSCRKNLFPAALDGLLAKNLYSIDAPLTGGIPNCLFQMHALTTLHLSGNALTGTLSDEVLISPTLRDLSLSHNKLTGSIPGSLLSREWSNLDLSYNLFTHSLTEVVGRGRYAHNASISLQQNRLSGKIPGSLINVRDISLLESNLFSCDLGERDLPDHDPEHGKYSCGSDTLDETMYAWIAVMSFAIVVSVILCWRYRRNAEGSVADAVGIVQKWWEAGALTEEIGDVPALLGNYTQVRAVIQVIVHIAATGMIWCMCVLLPMYIVMSTFYGTYSHQYAWALSAAYLSGTVPFALEFALLLALPALAFCSYRWASARIFTLANVASQAAAASKRAVSLGRRALVYSLYVLITFTVVLGVNIAYVVIALNQNGKVLTFSQFLLALFKVAFNSVCSPSLMRWISHRVLKDSNSRDFVSVQLVVSLINNILIPCFVVSIINPSCFYYLFKDAPKVTSSYIYRGQCVKFDEHTANVVECDLEEIVIAATSYDPPFEYSYQCSSSFITYYAPTYVIMCILAGFATPIIQMALALLHRRATEGTRWFALLDLVTPRIMKPVPADMSVAPIRDVFKLYFDAPQHLTTLLTYLGLLLTFGAVFPPLALCFFVTLLAITVFMRLKVGRFLYDARTKCMADYIRVINDECEGAGNRVKLRRAVLTVFLFSCLFYTLFLFDTLGDAIGYTNAYWVIIVVPAIPTCILAVHQFEKKEQGPLRTAPKPDRDVAFSMDSVDTVEMMTRSFGSTIDNPLR